MEIWDNVVERPEKNELRAVYIKGNLDSALEAGFMLPMVRVELFLLRRYLLVVRRLLTYQ